MWSIVPMLLLAAPATGAEQCPVPATQSSSVAQALIYSAQGLELLTRGQQKEATACLKLSAQLSPSDPASHYEYALALAQIRDFNGALDSLKKALDLGQNTRSAFLLQSVSFFELGQKEAALEAALRAGGFDGALVATLLGDEASAYSLGQWVEEKSRQGMFAAMALGLHQAQKRHLLGARQLNQVALAQAQNLSMSPEFHAVRQFELGLRKQGPLDFKVSLGAFLGHISNPRYLAQPQREQRNSLALQLQGKTDLIWTADSFLLKTGLGYGQQLMLNNRELSPNLDLNQIEYDFQVAVPLSKNPYAAQLHFNGQWVGIWNHEFANHLGNLFEGGPGLVMQVASGLELDIALSGVVNNLEQSLSASGNPSALDRNSVGQRVRMGLHLKRSQISARLDGLFVHDESKGAAFDSSGGGLSGRIVAQATKDIRLHTAVSAILRRFGPIGDQGVVGAAAFRDELRLSAQLGVMVRLNEFTEAVIQDTWVDNIARDQHGYTHNILSLGVLMRWD